jgi:hypothetical protein
LSQHRNSSDQPAAQISAESQALLQQLLVRPVAYFPVFARIGGGATAGLLLSQFFYWTPRTNNPDGWFYKTQVECKEETGLTRDEQDTARRRLAQRGLVEEKLAGLPATRHFRINMARVVELLVEAQKEDETKFAGIPQSSLRDSRKLVSANPTNRSAANQQANTESTAEITPENTPTPRAEFSTKKQQAKKGVGVAISKEPAKKRVGASELKSQHTLDDCRAYADHLRATGQGITNPAGFAKKIFATGEDDKQITEFLSSRQQEATAATQPPLDTSRCPDCKGSGWIYPNGEGNGVARCKHPKLTASQIAPEAA